MQSAEQHLLVEPDVAGVEVSSIPEPSAVRRQEPGGANAESGEVVHLGLYSSV